MRPYQIVATERILDRIKIADNYKKYGSVAGGGYIWHTSRNYVLIDDLKCIVMNATLVNKRNILAFSIITSQHLYMIFLNQCRISILLRRAAKALF